VDCGEQQVRARWVVVATLLPFPLRTALFALASPSRSYVVAGWSGNQGLPQGMYLSVGRGSTRSLRIGIAADGSEYLLVGGGGHPTGRKLPASAHLAELQRWGEGHFGEPGQTHLWSAQDYSSADLLPQIGPSPFGPPNLLMAGGFGKWGITNGSAAAVALTGMMQGSAPEWAGPLRPRIPHDPAGAGKVATLNLEVGAGLVRGWLADPQPAKLPEGVEDAGIVARRFPRPSAISRVDGTLRRCSAVCTHLGGILRYNDVERSWDCPLHGSRFAPDGEVLGGPAVAPLERA
jgi:nitrite reductase/ring-hydroxylating ferredoxin subunit